MNASPIQKSGHFKLREEPRDVKNTAWYIFKDEAKLLYSIDNANLKAHTGTMNFPVVSNGSEHDMLRIANNMVRVAGPVWEMAERYIQGATIAFPEHGIAAIVYQRIMDHMDHHIRYMNTRVDYVAPDAEDFRILGEFALAIRPFALAEDPNIEKPKVHQVRRMMPMRPTFEYATTEKVVEVEEKKTPPKPIEKMDVIERYMELHGYGN